MNNKETYTVHSPRVFKALVAKDLIPVSMGVTSNTGNRYFTFKNTTYFKKCLTEITSK